MTDTDPVGTGSPLGPLAVTVRKNGYATTAVGAVTVIVGLIVPAEFTVTVALPMPVE
jgi:hypothetical protein